MKNPLGEPMILVPVLGGQEIALQPNCSCGSANGAGAGGDCLCGSSSGGGF